MMLNLLIFILIFNISIISSLLFQHNRIKLKYQNKNNPLYSVDKELINEKIANSNKQDVWVPIGLKSGLKHNLPNEITIANERYVVWSNNNSDWSVLKDVCSHRLAPLSQGRIDKTTGCIECPYHGWQFNKEGTCTKIPQLDDPNQLIPKATTVKSFPVHITGDLIWASLPIGEGLISPINSLPNELFPVLDNCTFTSRELPYSVDFLIENFMDPAHIPFAHHGAQAYRADGSPIQMINLTSLTNTTHCEIGFEDLIRGKPRKGVVSYISPSYYSARRYNNNNKEIIFLLVVIAPIEPGKCRVFISAAPGMKFPIPIPIWFLHSFSNGFVDMDIWLHDQERIIRSNKKKSELNQYVLPTKSDYGVKFFRNWWNNYLSNSIHYGNNINNQLINYNKKDQLNRYDTHIKHCQICSNNLKNINRFLAVIPTITLSLVVILSNKYLKLFTILFNSSFYFILQWIKKKINGPTEDETISAAQF